VTTDFKMCSLCRFSFTR